MLYTCDYIREDRYGEWDQLVMSQEDAGFQQSTVWAEFKRLDRWSNFKLGLFEEGTGQLVGGAMVLRLSFSDDSDFFYIPAGPLLDYHDEKALYWQWLVLKEALLRLCDKKTTHIRIEPRLRHLPEIIKRDFRPSRFSLMPTITLVIGLSEEEIQILEQMKPKGRYNIGIAQKRGVQVEERPLDEIETFYKLHAATVERQQFKSRDLTYFRKFAGSLGTLVKLYVAKFDEEPLAAALVVYFGDRASYFFGASSGQHREIMANYGLHWKIIQDAKKAGLKSYDLWGIAPGHIENHPWAGLTRFKRQFGGRVLEFVGAQDLVLDEEGYRHFKEKHEAKA